MKTRALFVAVLVCGLVPLHSLNPVLADIDGDGIDEAGAFAVEVTGSARGNWVQVFERDGSFRMSNFIMPSFTNLQNLTADVNGNGNDELISMATNPANGNTVIQVRNFAGSQLYQAVLPSGFSQHRLFAVNYNGGTRTEIGVGMVSDSTSNVVLQVLELSGGVLQSAFTPMVVLTSGSTPTQWESGDFTNDGKDNVFVGFRRDSDGFIGFTVVNAETQATVGTRFVAGSIFSNVQMVVGDFHAGDAGVDVAVGMTITSDSSGFLRIVGETSGILFSGFALPAGFGNHLWRSVSDGTSDQVLLGATNNSTGNKLFKVVNPTTGANVALRPLGLATSTMTDLRSGNFDGVGNGEEVSVHSLRNDGFTELQVWSRSGVTIHAFKLPFGPSFVNPQVTILGNAGGQDDILVGATFVGGTPWVTIWDGFGNELLRRFIFNSDVV